MTKAHNGVIAATFPLCFSFFFFNQIISQPQGSHSLTGDSLGIRLGSNHPANLPMHLPTRSSTDDCYFPWLDICCREGFSFSFFFHEHSSAFFRSEDLLIYVFIPFCLDYKGSTCPSSLYISLSLDLEPTCQARLCNLRNQSHPYPQHASEVIFYYIFFYLLLSVSSMFLFYYTSVLIIFGESGSVLMTFLLNSFAQYGVFHCGAHLAFQILVIPRAFLPGVYMLFIYCMLAISGYADFQKHACSG